MDENEDLVPLEGPGNWVVPRRWHGPIPLNDRKGRVVSGMIAIGDVEMDGSGPRLVDLQIHRTGPGIGFSAEDLANIDWQGALLDAVYMRAAQWRLRGADRWLSGSGADEEWEEIVAGREQIHRAARTATRKNGVTPERLARVVELYETKGGIEAVQENAIEGRKLSRSYAYQLLARARKELAQ